VLIVLVDTTPERYGRRIIDLIHSRIGIEAELRQCPEDSVGNVLRDADKAGVWFAFVAWPWHEATDRCALNFLRFMFGSEPLGYDDVTLEQAIGLVRDEYDRLQRMIYAQQSQQQQQQQQYYAQQPPSMMYGQPPSMVPVQPGSVLPPPAPSGVPASNASTSTTAISPQNETERSDIQGIMAMPGTSTH